MKKAVVLGAGGFIGGHLVKRLKNNGYWVCGADIKEHEFEESTADKFIVCDLRKYSNVESVIDNTIDEVYQLAADMGGAEFIFTGENDIDIMHNSAVINLNVCDVCRHRNVKTIFYSSSACVYPRYNQLDPENPNCKESSVYPAHPDSEYGWEKLFSERLYLTLQKNTNIQVRIARFHNIFGPLGTWCGGREKAPAALCRKVIMAKDNEFIEMFGDGKQTRSFLYIDECIEGIIRLVNSQFSGPINIGSDEMVTINHLMEIILAVDSKKNSVKHIDGPQGVRGRNSDNNLIKETLGWSPSLPLEVGITKTYKWIKTQITI
ncbi:NAD-dependent dehydratase [archaeon]|nr:NAD-dependent dehydratase [archaeon]